jgi:hypothetical protein
VIAGCAGHGAARSSTSSARHYRPPGFSFTTTVASCPPCINALQRCLRECLLLDVLNLPPRAQEATLLTTMQARRSIQWRRREEPVRGTRRQPIYRTGNCDVAEQAQQTARPRVHFTETGQRRWSGGVPGGQQGYRSRKRGFRVQRLVELSGTGPDRLCALQRSARPGTNADSRQVDEHQNGKVSLGLSIVVRITLKDGTYHEVIQPSNRFSIGLIIPGHRLWLNREWKRQSSIL